MNAVKFHASVEVGVHFKISIAFIKIDKHLGFKAGLSLNTPKITLDMGLTKEAKPNLVIHKLDMGIHPEKVVAEVFNFACPKGFPGCGDVKKKVIGLLIGKTLGKLVELMEGAVERNILKLYKEQIYSRIPDTIELV